METLVGHAYMLNQALNVFFLHECMCTIKTSNKAVMVLHYYIQITFEVGLATKTETKESLKKLFSTGEQQVICSI